MPARVDIRARRRSFRPPAGTPARILSGREGPSQVVVVGIAELEACANKI